MTDVFFLGTGQKAPRQKPPDKKPPNNHEK